MAEIGLSFGQFAIGANTYTAIRLSDPAPTAERIIHDAANVTTFPVKELGYRPYGIAATLRVTATSVDDCLADVLNGSAARKISWMLGAVEVYSYAYSGDLRSVDCINPYGSATRQYDISVAFTFSTSKVYKASDDSVLWGG